MLKGRTPLHFALIQSLGGPLSQFDGSGSVAGVKVALDRINNDTTLLPGYTLHYTFADSKVLKTSVALQLYTSFTFAMVVVMAAWPLQGVRTPSFL